MSFDNAKSLSIDWNGTQFLMTARKETGLFDYATSPDGTTWTTHADVSNSMLLMDRNVYQTKWTGTTFQLGGDITDASDMPSLLHTYTGDRIILPPTGSAVPSAPVHDIEMNLEKPHIVSFPKQMTILLGSGSGQNMAYSYDEGETWNSVATGFPLNGAAYAADWNGRIWLAVGTGSAHTMAYSTDGIHWTGRGMNLFTIAGRTVRWDATHQLWIAGGQGGNVLAYSHDGLYWTGIPTVGGITACLSLASNESTTSPLWVAGGVGGMAYSNTGQVWTSISGGLDGECRDIHWNGSFWMAVGTASSGDHTIALSADGIHWVTHLNPTFTGLSISQFYASARSNVTIVACDNQSAYTTLSNQFSVFDQIDMSGTMTAVTAVGHQGSLFLMGGGNKVSTSIDGLNWTLSTGVPSEFTAIHSFAWNRPNEGYLQVKPISLAVGEGGPNSMAYSEDGIGWSGLGPHLFSVRANAARWNGSIWVAVGKNEPDPNFPGPQNAWVATSINGRQWESRDTTTPLFVEGRDVAWNGRAWVAVGEGAVYSIAYSEDGLVWEGVNLPEGYSFSGNSVCWTGSYWLATGSGTCTCFTSATGTQWTPHLYPMTNAQGGIQDIGVLSTQCSTGNATIGYLADSSLNANKWQSDSSVYNASTGVYEGPESTMVSGSSVPGEWVEFTFSTSHAVVQWIAGWNHATSAVRTAYPKSMVLAGSNDAGASWIELDTYQSTASTSPAPSDGTSPVLLIRSISPSVLDSYSTFRIIIPAIFGGGSATHVEIGEVELWMRPSATIPLPVRYRPVSLPEYTVVPAQKPVWITHVPYLLITREMAPVSGMLNNGYGATYQMQGLASGYITSACNTGDLILASTSTNQLLYMDAMNMGTDLDWDTEWGELADLSGNLSSINGVDYNKTRILAGGTGGSNGITYHTLNENTPGIWTDAIQSDRLINTVLGVHSNSGFGHVFVRDALALSRNDIITLVGPKYYENRESVQFEINFQTRFPQTNAVSLRETVTNFYRGSRGPSGPIPGAFSGPAGEDALEMGPSGPTGPDGELYWIQNDETQSVALAESFLQVQVGKNTSAGDFALDVSGNMRAHRARHSSLMFSHQTYAWGGDFTAVTIDYERGMHYTLDMDEPIADDFELVVSNYPELVSRTLNVTLMLDYRNVPVDRYICGSVQLVGAGTYPIVFAGGKPNILTTVDYYKQTITVVCSATGIWKVVSSGQSITI